MRRIRHRRSCPEDSDECPIPIAFRPRSERDATSGVVVVFPGSDGADGRRHAALAEARDLPRSSRPSIEGDGIAAPRRPDKGRPLVGPPVQIALNGAKPGFRNAGSPATSTSPKARCYPEHGTRVATIDRAPTAVRACERLKRRSPRAGRVSKPLSCLICRSGSGERDRGFQPLAASFRAFHGSVRIYTAAAAAVLDHRRGANQARIRRRRSGALAHLRRAGAAAA